MLRNSFVKRSFVKISLRGRHALIFGDGAFSHKINHVGKVLEILNLEGHYWFKSYSNYAEWVDFAY